MKTILLAFTALLAVTLNVHASNVFATITPLDTMAVPGSIQTTHYLDYDVDDTASPEWLPVVFTSNDPNVAVDLTVISKVQLVEVATGNVVGDVLPTLADGNGRVWLPFKDSFVGGATSQYNLQVLVNDNAWNVKQDIVITPEDPIFAYPNDQVVMDGDLQIPSVCSTMNIDHAAPRFDVFPSGRVLNDVAPIGKARPLAAKWLIPTGAVSGWVLDPSFTIKVDDVSKDGVTLANLGSITLKDGNLKPLSYINDKNAKVTLKPAPAMMIDRIHALVQFHGWVYIPGEGIEIVFFGALAKVHVSAISARTENWYCTLNDGVGDDQVTPNGPDGARGVVGALNWLRK